MSSILQDEITFRRMVEDMYIEIKKEKEDEIHAIQVRSSRFISYMCICMHGNYRRESDVGLPILSCRASWWPPKAGSAKPASKVQAL